MTRKPAGALHPLRPVAQKQTADWWGGFLQVPCDADILGFILGTVLGAHNMAAQHGPGLGFPGISCPWLGLARVQSGAYYGLF